MKRRKGKLLRKMMSGILSVMLVAGMMSGAISVNVYADVPENSKNTGNEVCYSIDGGKTWIEADTLKSVLSSSEAASTEGFMIKLLRNITLDGTENGNWTSDEQILGSENKTWIIDGDGKKITRGEDTNILFGINKPGSKVIMKNIIIDGGAIWSSDDPATRTNSGESRDGNAHLMYVKGDAELVLEEGVILQNNDSNGVIGGGAVSVGGFGIGVDKGKLTIRDGVEIRNNHAISGGAIKVSDDGELIMEGGKIYGNCATNSGGGVYNSNSFNMKGGEIYDNIGENGGGIYVGVNATLNIEDSIINSNQANYDGGGVYIYYNGNFNMENSQVNNNKAGEDGGGIDNKGNFDMKNSQVNNNKAGVFGGGINNEGSFQMTGGEVCNNKAEDTGGGICTGMGGMPSRISITTITDGIIKNNIAKIGGGCSIFFNGELALSGKPIIIGNVNEKGDADNVYLNSSNPNYPERTISILNALTDGAEVGVRTEGPANITGENTADYSRFFTSDEESFKVENIDNNTVILVEKIKIIPSVTLSETLTIHSDSDTASIEAILDEAKKTLEVSGVNNLDEGMDYTYGCTYGENEKKAVISFLLTETGKEKYYIGSGSIEKVECTVLVHRWESEWSRDTDGHWHGCPLCEMKKDVGEHTYKNEWKTDSTVHWNECVCGARSGEAAHSYGDWLITKEAAEGEEGLRERSCTVCQYKQTEIIPAAEHKHKYGTEWKTDSTGHWYECICTAKTEEAVHTEDSGTVTKQPTETEDGEKTYKCSVCGYVMRIEKLDKTGSSQKPDTGTVNADKEQEINTPDSDAEISGDYNNNGNDNDNDNGNDSNNGNDNNDNNNSSIDKNFSDKHNNDEPKTGDVATVEIYATLSMIAGFSYLMLYFGKRKGGMTEQEKKEITASIIAWGRKGGKIRKMVAVVLIFVLLAYYHSIGKQVSVDWKEAYEK